MTERDDPGGCGSCLAVFMLALVVALIVAAVISFAALVDPFNWLPPVGEIWEDCQGDCALEHRFPGFWLHVVTNLAYATAAVGALSALALGVDRFRAARVERFGALEPYVAARSQVTIAAAAGGALSLLPIAVALV